MTLIDVLFWLLIALMGGVGWAIEVGLGQRFRAALAACVLASFGSGIIIMFWIDDKTSIQHDKIGPWVKKAKSGGDNPWDVVVEEDKGGGAKGKDGDGNGGAAKGEPDAIIDMHKKVYNRAPFKDCPECPDVVILPEGFYQAGSPPDETGRTPDERTVTRVAIEKPFAIGRLELLRGEFEAFVAQTNYASATQCNLGKRRGKFNWKQPGLEQDPRHPVTCLSQDDAEAYLKWLSVKSDREYRLPTEAEWEYAARAETTTPFWTGDALLRQQANIGRTRDGTTPAGSFDMNNFGLADMVGSLWEMTSDCKPPAVPTTPQAGVPPPPCERLIKGGGWNSPLSTGRHAARQWQLDTTVYNYIGIRVVRAIDERDNEKVLTKDQRIALAKDEKAAKEIRATELESGEQSRRDAREAVVRAAEIAAFKTEQKKAIARTAAETKAKADAEAFNNRHKPAPPAKK